MRTGDAAAEIRHLCRSLAGSEEEFRGLDAAAGDGDLGVTVRLLAEAVEGLLEAGVPASWRGLLGAAAESIAAASPSTFGSFVAIGLRAAGRAFEEEREDAGAEDAARALGAGIAQVRRRGGAEPGEKTFLDALLPAFDALRGAVASGSADALAAMRQAAEQGVEASAAAVAQHGRAAWVGERTRGLPDAGAVVVVRALEALAPPGRPWQPSRAT